MRTLSDASDELAQGDVRSRGPSTGATLSIGYWLQATAGSTFNVYLVKESEYPKVLSLEAFTFYEVYSAEDVSSAYLPTTHLTALGEPVRLVIFGTNYAATTIRGVINMQEAECVAVEPCQNQGLCVQSGTCECPPNGWTGATCSTPACAAGTCNERQTCTGPNTCSCKPGWSGVNCAIASCAEACVSGQGSCTAPNVCTCVTGFSGATCQGINGGYTNFTAGSSACISTGGDSCTQTESRTCTAPPPSNGGAGCGVLGPATRQVSCTCPPVHGGYSDWGEFGLCAGSPVCTQSRSRSCTNPPPALGGADCSLLGADVEARTCDSCGLNGAPLLSAAVLTTDAAQMKELAESRGWQTKAEWDADNEDRVDFLIPFIVVICVCGALIVAGAVMFLHMRRQQSQVHSHARSQTVTVTSPQVQMAAQSSPQPSPKAGLYVPQTKQAQPAGGSLHAFHAPSKTQALSPSIQVRGVAKV